MSGVLKANPAQAIHDFLRECQAQRSIDVELVYRVAMTTLKYLKATAKVRAQLRPNQELESRWYAGLDAGQPDWGVYDTDLYLADLWACWVVYSRQRMIAVQQPGSLPPVGVLRDIGPVERVADLGCGFGYTTSAWKELYPYADVVGTNLDGIQMRLAQARSARFGFRLVTDVSGVGAPVDLVFASEYFEHFPRPVDHLTEVLDALTPKALLIANAFGTRSIGHFHEYGVGGEMLDGKTTSRRFNSELRQRGYVKVKTKLWNARPSYWKLT